VLQWSSLLALLENFRLGWKDLPRTNILAYCEHNNKTMTLIKTTLYAECCSAVCVLITVIMLSLVICVDILTFVMLTVIMLCVIMQCQYADCRNAESLTAVSVCCYRKSHYTGSP
jgi:hypothetical protein